MLYSFIRIFVVGLAVAFASLAMAGARTALVVGNSAYPFGPLANPANDAKLIAESLKQTGFDVTIVLDANRATLQTALLDFSRDIRTKDTVGLFYYAGHGAQVNGANYLIPIDADIKAESEVKIFGINVDEFVATLERADGRTNIVILDACRNNPFGSGTRSVSRGMALPDAPAGTFVALSTSPGAVALDGEGQNSPYALALSKSMLEPNVSIEQAFKVTRRLVLESTKQKQVPWETSSLTGDFFFLPKAAEPAAAVPEPAPKLAEPAAEVPAPAPKPEPEVKVAIDDQPAAPAQAEGVRAIEPEVQVFPVGKWPEGLVIADNAIWVAESGSRQIVKLDPSNGDLIEAVKVGRLPVSMAKDAQDNVYVATFTDQKVVMRSPNGKTKTLNTFKNTILRGIDVGNGALYVATTNELTDPRKSVVNKIDPGSSRISPVAVLDLDVRSFVHAQEASWLLDTNNTVTLLDDSKMLSQRQSQGFIWSMAANLDAVYVGGREDQQTGRAIVERHYRSQPNDVTRQVLDSDELILAITANNDRVAALGAGGTVWILDAASLKPLKKFNTGREPRAAVFENGHLFITSHQGTGENGVVMVYSNVGNLD